PLDVPSLKYCKEIIRKREYLIARMNVARTDLSDDEELLLQLQKLGFEDSEIRVMRRRGLSKPLGRGGGQNGKRFVLLPRLGVGLIVHEYRLSLVKWNTINSNNNTISDATELKTIFGGR